MDRIDPNTFRFHFPNLLYASGRKLCYLCFQVETGDYFSCDDSDRGVFRNKVHPWARCHAEQCFLSWFRDQYPCRDEYYNVTWFLSWSPCPTCAEEVVEFLEEYRNLTLSIFTSRLYYFYHPNYQQGLRKLWDAGVQLDIMSCDDFEHCWDNFVDHKGMRFQRRNLLKDYDFLAAELQEILRNPMDRIDPNTFRFHFPNLLYASGRKLCYLCFQVETEDYFSCDDSDRGVFRNKVHPWARCHAEQCFLSWFRDQYPYRDEYYNVTWFLSWSPCPTCAEEVVEFLEEYRNLTLSIFTSRLYYFWDPNYQEGLCKLWDAGVQLDIMSCDDFKHCWDNFVDHKGMRFQRRNLLKDYDFLAAELQEILRNPMDRIDPNTFRFHFPNLLYASGRKLCYLCFQVETEDYFSCDDSDRGVFRNKVHPWARCHAEQCFLSWFRDQYPYRDEYYNVTWFLSWSPCPTCAEEVVEFLEEYRNLTLSIFTSRLYYFWDPNYQEGLCKLWDAGVQLDIMSCDDFKHCWDNFVDHKGMRFQRRNLLKDYDFLAAELQEILRNPTDRIDPNTFRFHFPNLLYASGRKLCYLCFQVETEDYFSYNDSDRGVFRNKVHPWARCHAEQCFLSWFRDQYPYRDEYYNVTWFLSWSPCPTCAEEVVEFLEEYRNLTLSIFTSRLYYFWDPNYQEGLCKLWDAGVQLDIMSCDDFKHCWDNFVDHKGMRFRRRNLLKGYDFLAAKLQEILR